MPNNMIEWQDMKDVPDCPEWIYEGVDKRRKSLIDDIQEYYSVVVWETYRLGLLSKIGLPQIDDYVFNFRLWREYALIVAKNKAVAEYSNGTEGFTGAYKVMRDTRKEMRDFENLWGLNPSAMMKIDVPNKIEEKDEFLG